ncbi:MAG TPA: hypothetical protein VFG78_13370 [Gemmatimonadota bacterium]|nr:hypothetical protein [Gemmatimonadota bacterium]
MTCRARAQGRLGVGIAVVLAALTGPTARPVPAQQTQAREPALSLHEAMAPPGFWAVPAPEEGGEVEVDVRTRFEAFQRELADDFGAPVGDGGPEGERGENHLETRVGDALARRWEGSRMFRWYEGMVGVYDRFEGFYQRVERSSRWATRGVSVDPDLEAAVDGKLRVAVERRVAGFDMGLKVEDAVGGRLGLRLGGVIRGYKFGFDVSDVVSDGRWSLQIRRTTR